MVRFLNLSWRSSYKTISNHLRKFPISLTEVFLAMIFIVNLV